MGSADRKILLANPRGFCAGVERAIGIVERALELHGAHATLTRLGCRPFASAANAGIATRHIQVFDMVA